MSGNCVWIHSSTGLTESAACPVAMRMMTRQEGEEAEVEDDDDTEEEDEKDDDDEDDDGETDDDGK